MKTGTYLILKVTSIGIFQVQPQFCTIWKNWNIRKTISVFMTLNCSMFRNFDIWYLILFRLYLGSLILYRSLYSRQCYGSLLSNWIYTQQICDNLMEILIIKQSLLFFRHPVFYIHCLHCANLEFHDNCLIVCRVINIFSKKWIRKRRSSKFCTFIKSKLCNLG